MRTEDHPLEYARLRRRDPGRELRRRRDDRLGPGHAIARSTPARRPRASRPGSSISSSRATSCAAASRWCARAARRTGLAAARARAAAADGAIPVRDAPALRALRPHGGGAARGSDPRRDARGRAAAAARAAALRSIATPCARCSRRPRRRPSRGRAGSSSSSTTACASLAVKEGAAVRLLARTGGDRAHIYPEVARAVAHLPLSSCRDRRRGRGPRRAPGAAPSSASSGASRRTIPRRSRGPRSRCRSSTAPSTCWARSASTRAALPLARRKQLLAEFVPARGLVRFSDHVEGDGERLFEAAAASGLEGVIAKRADSRYESGRRSRSWLKLKAPRTARARDRRLDGGQGLARAPRSAAARRAARRRVGLRGKRRLRARRGDDRRAPARGSRPRALRSLPASASRIPRRAARAGRGPSCVCDVRYTELTSAGLLRQPVFVALRPRGSPRGVRRSRRAARPAPLPAQPAPQAQPPPAPPARAEAHAARQGLLARRGLHEGRPARLLRGGLALARALPARPAGGADALPRRHRRQELLPEERAGLHAGLGAAPAHRRHRLLPLQRPALAALRGQLGRDPAARLERARLAAWSGRTG